MTNQLFKIVAALSALLLLSACDEGVDDWDSSARVSGSIFTDASHTQGVEGVQVIIEADPEAENQYHGPDRWTATDANGHYEGAVFLGYENGSYNTAADLSVTYFWNNKFFAWGGGISVAPGSDFTLPPVDTTMFLPMGGGQ